MAEQAYGESTIGTAAPLADDSKCETCGAAVLYIKAYCWKCVKTEGDRLLDERLALVYKRGGKWVVRAGKAEALAKIDADLKRVALNVKKVVDTTPKV